MNNKNKKPRKTTHQFMLKVIFQRKLYFSVVEDVISNVREAFLDEGVDEQVLQELKQVKNINIINETF